MAAMGLSLNQITMLALTLIVGIVIDDAIIVLENIYRFMEEKGAWSPYRSGHRRYPQKFGFAVMATTISLLAVFLPRPASWEESSGASWLFGFTTQLLRLPSRCWCPSL